VAAVAAAEEARALAREVGDRRTEGRALYVAGFLEADGGGSLGLLDEAIAVARDVNDPWCLAHALGGAGTVLGGRGDHASSRLLLEESIAVCEAMGDSYIVNTSRFWLARSLLYQGEREASEALLHQVVGRAREIGDTFSLPLALCHLAFFARLRGDDDTAFAQLDEAIAISRRVGTGRESQLTMALWDTALLHFDRGQFDEARRLLVDLAGSHRGTNTAAGAAAALALVDVAAGDLRSARVRMDEVRGVFTSTDPHDVSFIALAGARVELADDNVEEAGRLARQALARDIEGGSSQRLSWTFEILVTLAGVLGASGRPWEAIRLCGAVDAHHVELGRARALTGHPLWAPSVGRLRDALRPEEADRAWAEGAAMTLDATLDLARDG
jgi:tetratricopeptide (TPR) repeat protein